MSLWFQQTATGLYAEKVESTPSSTSYFLRSILILSSSTPKISHVVSSFSGFPKGNCVFVQVDVLRVVTPLKMEIARSSETLGPYHNTSWRRNPEDHDLNLHDRENLKSHPFYTLLISFIPVHLFSFNLMNVIILSEKKFHYVL